MIYKLHNNSKNNYNAENIKYDILKIRGITNPKKFLNLTGNVEIPYSKLKNINKAVECAISHFENGDNIYIQGDNDVDGATSFGALYGYIKRAYPNLNINWDVQKDKGHGIDLSQMPKNTKLVFIPDAGSEQLKEHKQLYEMGIDCIVLDHHKVKKESQYAIIVNNQISEEYENKDLSGVGIVYKFLQALDDELWLNYANDYIDLVAIGNIADMMDTKSYETRYYINKGLKHIKNKFIKKLIEKQDFSLKGHLNQIGVAFYIAPLINAAIRFCSQEDKKLVFEAIIGSNKTFIYKPRKNKNDLEEKEPIEEDIYTHVVRMCINAKSRQDRNKVKNSDKLIELINNQDLSKNKIIICTIDSSIEKTMTGLMAMQLVSHYMKPVILLRENEKKPDELSGSMRGVENSKLEDFQQFLINLKVCKSVDGHPNAAGVSIKKGNLNKLIELSNKKLESIDFEKVYTVDYIVPFLELTDDFINDIFYMNDIWGQGLKESLIAITDIIIPCKDIKLIGEKKNTIAFNIEDIHFVKFKCSDNEYNELIEDKDGWGSIKEKVRIDVVGKCNINEYNGIRQLQIEIQDIEMKE